MSSTNSARDAAPRGLKRFLARRRRASSEPSQPDAVPVYLATLRLPSTFGGVTNAMLQHARMLARTASSQVTVLVLDDELDAADREADLRARGLLSNEVAFRSMWAELREPASADWLKGRALGALPTVPRHASMDSDTSPGRGGVNRYTDDGGNLVAIDHLRSDGSVLAREVREGGRTSVFAVATGNGRVVDVRSIRGLRRRWLRHAVTGPAVLLVESKGLLGTVAGFTLPGVSQVFVVHGAHLHEKAQDPHGPLDDRRSDFLGHIDTFDRVVFLTHAQRRDVEERCGARDNFAVVPNARDVEVVETARDEMRGVVVARLVAAKGVDAAMRATDAASRAVGRRLALDVLGEGTQRPKLERLIRTLQDSDVRLHGHVHDVPARFAGASFSILASQTEGHPLVLVESMAQGCIPIAYDIRYGPSEIIRDGVDGLLVPAGDEAALARAVERVVTMEPTAREAMRGAAQARAQAFGEAAVGRVWRDLLEGVTGRSA